MRIFNPATAQTLAVLREDSLARVVEKTALLRLAFAHWSAKPLAERIKVIARFNQQLEKRVEKLAGILTSESGKPLQQSRNEINGAVARINWMLENAEKYLSDEWVTNTDTLKEKISYEPLGVICNISAWNYPYLVGVNVFIPALLAGNTVLYKPSEYATLTGMEIEKLFYYAGLEQNAFKIAIGGKATGENLMDLRVDGYFFTGSYKTGKYIYEKVASRMLPCQLELGGKDPLYVADDIEDIAAVAAATADGAFYNNGQSCCAVERIYVHEKVYDEYVAEFVKAVKSWKLGLPTDDGVYFGAITRKEQLKVLENQVLEARAKGATLKLGGHIIVHEGNFFEPTILTDVDHNMKIMQEESFGPVIGIMKVSSDKEAIELMNDTEYGLTASVYSSNGERAQEILSQVNAGTGYWNCCDRVTAGLPWAGRKHSGFGATLSHQGLRAFTKTKAWQMKG
ncbi:aldehyde dehydrogenase family protein [Chitinophaga ginsengisegetis]|uniref:aldehyde dehydrogenase family protein n=1 Tax=Chitinophaga ginsengisegetis TaxID=393003 RepID=UPI000DB9E7EF|nr:aldehyde dehydrogenase family protein [Chitinophaga ginsengisegetis]MDR6569567.1 acyl-CoA reductase-like NAD-dependent aldehyde dehydrogenase [Chitinophaga ginsengisegetis]MDR6649300.1 acyl-CoA reductase-like NAD-dependent aldehyde dehydrogenase [Chitinophaga ginsengisegetis]MDR6655650.1 acyl-CoA reductase-like NAD-dependent aldehyde dehydrogenase [Chitinophaga ginsengisegetis]